jgi:hypothetical protein
MCRYEELLLLRGLDIGGAPPSPGLLRLGCVITATYHLFRPASLAAQLSTHLDVPVDDVWLQRYVL